MEEAEIERKILVGKILTHVLTYLTKRFVKEGFEWLLPITLSKIVDPLWPDPCASIEKRIEIEIYEQKVRAITSMIVHKIVACSILYPKLFILSPNIRIEKRERAKSGIHLYEFTQLDFEIRYASSKDVRKFVEDVLYGLIKDLKKEKAEELKALGRYESLKIPKPPFKVFDREELEKESKEWEKEVAKFEEPVWIVNIPREFYDFEDFESKKWDNFDLILPGLGEVLSGAKREYEYEKILKKMERDGIRKENYSLLLKLAKEGKIKPTCGAGIGIERLVKWITGVKHIAEVQPFPRVPGYVFEL